MRPEEAYIAYKLQQSNRPPIVHSIYARFFNLLNWNKLDSCKFNTQKSQHYSN